MIKQAVILAAGESSRFWPLNQRHKSLIEVMGKPLILYTIEALNKIGIKDVIVVQGSDKNTEKVLKQYNLKIKFAVQKEPKSTGDAVWQTKDFIKKGSFLVIGPHKIDLLEYLPAVLKKSKANQNKIILTGVETETPWEYGIIKFQKSKATEIVENPNAGQEPSKIKATEVYVFPYEFFDVYKKLPKKEDSLINAINVLIKKSGAEVVILKKDTASLKYPWHLFNLLKILFESKGFKKGISSSAKIGKNVVLKGNIYVGDNSIVRDNVVINGPCYIGDNCQIGVGTLIRGPVIFEDEIVTGAFFEIKNSIVQKGTHFHSGYIGDSIIGKKCRFGAGFISANRRMDRGNIKTLVKDKKIDTKLTYFGIVVGDNSRFGIHCGTMPGIVIGSNCNIGPGSVVFENIADNSDFITRFEKTINKHQ